MKYDSEQGPLISPASPPTRQAASGPRVGQVLSPGQAVPTSVPELHTSAQTHRDIPQQFSEALASTSMSRCRMSQQASEKLGRREWLGERVKVA